MHIPDGYLSPETYIAGYAVAVPLLAYSVRKLKKELNENSLPLVATLTALSFLVMMINVPIPGGTSGHAIGTAVISILFNPWIAFLSLSIVLLIQALVFGDGGITAWAIASLGMGFLAAFTASFIYKLFYRLNKNIALFLAGWFSIVVASLFVAVVLGIQPMIAHDEKGNPLFFPFDLKITIPAIVGSHMLYFGVIEGIYTLTVFKFLEKINSQVFSDVSKEA